MTTELDRLRRLDLAALSAPWTNLGTEMYASGLYVGTTLDARNADLICRLRNLSSAMLTLLDVAIPLADIGDTMVGSLDEYKEVRKSAAVHLEALLVAVAPFRAVLPLDDTQMSTGGKPATRAHACVDVRFKSGEKGEDAPMRCSCGWTGQVKEYPAHQTADRRDTRTPGGSTGVLGPAEPVAPFHLHPRKVPM